MSKPYQITNQQYRLALIGLCFDGNSSYISGAAEGPSLMRSALFSPASNMWSESGINLGEPATFFDAGDISAASCQQMFTLIEESITKLLEQDLPVISLGGDHSITFPVLKAYSKKYPQLSVLHFDAHPDLYDDFGGNPFSHASPFARVLEAGLIKRLVQVGIRTMNGHQREQVDRFGVEVYQMKDWQDNLRFEFDTPLYISFDIDGLDPAFAPGVAHREAGGLSTRQALNIIQSVKANVVGADIVEFNPRMDQLNITSTVCAKLIKEIAAKILVAKWLRM
jgi:arginase